MRYTGFLGGPLYYYLEPNFWHGLVLPCSQRFAEEESRRPPSFKVLISQPPDRPVFNGLQKLDFAILDFLSWVFITGLS